LIFRLNKIVHIIDEVDERNSQLISINGENKVVNLCGTGKKNVDTEPHQVLEVSTA
jgi:hypothetical protein